MHHWFKWDGCPWLQHLTADGQSSPSPFHISADSVLLTAEFAWNAGRAEISREADPFRESLGQFQVADLDVKC